MESWFDNLLRNHYNSSFGFTWQEYRVFDLRFDEDSVIADVFNGEDFNYVTIKFRQFSVHEKDKLKSIAEKPEVKFDLINGIIPDELYDAGVRIMPSSSFDFMVDCSCWTSGFLCNDAMAVLNRLEEIFNQDPFRIFSLKGFDLNNVDRFPVKTFKEIFNNTYNGNLGFLLDSYLSDMICIIFDDLEDMVEDIGLSFNDGVLNLPLNINGDYQVTNNSFKNRGDFISLVKSSHEPLWDLTLELIRNHDLIPEIFKLNNGNVRVRWIPDITLDADFNKDLITVEGESISKTDQANVFISLMIDDLLSVLYELHDYSDSDVLKLLFNRLNSQTDRAKSLVSDVSRNLSVYDLKHEYQINITDNDDEFILVFELDDDLDRLRHACHVRKLFNYHNLYWTLSTPLTLNRRQFMKYLKHVEGYLDDLNVKITRSFNLHEGRFKIKLTLSEEDYLTVNNISSSSWMVDLGDCLISAEEFQKLTIDESGLIRINGEYYMIDPVKFKSLQSDILFLPNNFESYELLQIALLGRYRNLRFNVGDQFKQLLDFQGELQQPGTLKGRLRHYQLTGYSWLIQNIKSGFGSILADDMGLGKTVQVLSVILYLKENDVLDGQVLIVAPTTLITNWTSEIEKFTDLTYDIYHGTVRSFNDDAELIITSYGMVRSDEEEFSKRSWFICVIDEAQNIKNPSTKQTKAIKNINAENRIALTGTPIENRLLDYWSIFDFTNEGYLKARASFKREYADPIGKNPNDKVMNNLKTITKPFILRRLKTDRSIIDDLPDKIVNDVHCNLTPKQLKLYEELVKSGLGNLEEDKTIKRKGQILKLITSLKQICNHPVQYLKKGKVNLADSFKLELLIEIVDNILDVDEKVIIFTQYVEMGKIIRDVCLKKFNREVLFLHGSLKSDQRERIIRNFQDNDSYPILIATLKTGGVGLNLTSAQNVIHYDLWWNPAVENQATDRAYRIGQDKDVMVYRFITKGTLEERIDLLLKSKLELADNAIMSSETFITELSDEELREMLELRIN